MFGKHLSQGGAKIEQILEQFPINDRLNRAGKQMLGRKDQIMGHKID